MFVKLQTFAIHLHDFHLNAVEQLLQLNCYSQSSVDGGDWWLSVSTASSDLSLLCSQGVWEREIISSEASCPVEDDLQMVQANGASWS